MKSVMRYVYPIILIVVIILTYIVFMDSSTYFGQYINLVAICFMLIATIFIQIATGDIGYFFKSFVNTKDNRNKKAIAIKHTMVAWMLSGILYFLLYLIDVYHIVDGVLIDNVAMSLNSILYGVIGVLMLYPSKIYFEQNDTK